MPQVYQDEDTQQGTEYIVLELRSELRTHPCVSRTVETMRVCNDERGRNRGGTHTRVGLMNLFI